MYCNKCGVELPGNTRWCENCKRERERMQASNPKRKRRKKQKCMPAFILGLIGSIFGLLGGINTTMISITGSNKAFILLFGGSVIGLIGACMCRNKTYIGSLLEILGAFFIISQAYGGRGATFFCVIALVLLLTGGIIGFVYAYFVRGEMKRIVRSVQKLRA